MVKFFVFSIPATSVPSETAFSVACDIQSVLNWKKADKPFPKKSSPMASILQVNQAKTSDKKSNPISKLYESAESNSINNDSSNESKSKLTIKDLCPEDKTRIANLIKELAKISDEKKQIEKSLEEERRHKEAEITEILKQQETLLNEKEILIKKFSKTQQKLIELQKEKKENNKLPPRPKKQINEEKINSAFNPFKSSTPKNLSPRSLSPISTSNEIKSTKIINDSSDDTRKIELIKEQIELAEEQKKLKALLESQEEILREKQAQIMVQQQIHLKRLEELSLLKAENQKINQNNPPNFVYPSQLPLHQFSHHVLPSENFQLMNLIPKQVPFQVQQEQSSTPVTQSDSGIKLNDLDEESLENLANIVYKKMVMKKKKDVKPVKKQLKHEKELNKKSKEMLDENDECLVDFIIEETKSINSLKVNDKKIDRNKARESLVSQEDLEESKLIEDLFFIK
ncbi:unnamed protein product [Brachionus calyciflorus]|uniref:Uncharacterized protein n=1 Tax=Brachionus calyciflorus TaxID=104777 RepID=A0A813URM4_9BILA|nr:unnamed protein product [Brachionus calyciflorus]